MKGSLTLDAQMFLEENYYVPLMLKQNPHPGRYTQPIVIDLCLIYNETCTQSHIHTNTQSVQLIVNDI